MMMRSVLSSTAAATIQRATFPKLILAFQGKPKNLLAMIRLNEISHSRGSVHEESSSMLNLGGTRRWKKGSGSHGYARSQEGKHVT